MKLTTTVLGLAELLELESQARSRGLQASVTGGLVNPTVQYVRNRQSGCVHRVLVGEPGGPDTPPTTICGWEFGQAARGQGFELCSGPAGWHKLMCDRCLPGARADAKARLVMAVGALSQDGVGAHGGAPGTRREQSFAGPGVSARVTLPPHASLKNTHEGWLGR